MKRVPCPRCLTFAFAENGCALCGRKDRTVTPELASAYQLISAQDLEANGFVIALGLALQFGEVPGG